MIQIYQPRLFAEIMSFFGSSHRFRGFLGLEHPHPNIRFGRGFLISTFGDTNHQVSEAFKIAAPGGIVGKALGKKKVCGHEGYHVKVRLQIEI